MPGTQKHFHLLQWCSLEINNLETGHTKRYLWLFKICIPIFYVFWVTKNQNKHRALKMCVSAFTYIMAVVNDSQWQIWENMRCMSVGYRPMLNCAFTCMKASCNFFYSIHVYEKAHHRSYWIIQRPRDGKINSYWNIFIKNKIQSFHPLIKCP